jgi:Tfp pilus assembly protein PilE
MTTLPPAVTRRMPRAIRVLLMILGIVLVVAILLVIAMPKFDERPIHAYRARMFSDLSALRTIEEDFYRDSGRYTAALRGRFRPKLRSWISAGRRHGQRVEGHVEMESRPGRGMRCCRQHA